MPSRSLHRRFQRAIVGVAGLMSVAVAIAVFLSAQSHYVEAEKASARAMAAAVQQTLAVGVYARDAVLLKELVEGLSRHPAVGRVEVRDLAGAVLAGNPAPPRERSAGTPPASLVSPLASPFDEKEILGHLDIWMDLDRLRAQAARQAALPVAAIVVLLAAVLVVFNLLAERMLSRPMHRLARELDRIRPGTGLRMAVNPSHEIDEVGKVTASVNRLLELQQQALARERTMRTEIAALETRYRDIVDSTSAGIFILAADGRLLHANPALGRLLGDAPDRLARAGAEGFAQAFLCQPAELARLVDQARASSQPESADLELVRGDDDRIWVHCMVGCKQDPETGDERVDGVLYDITRRKALESAAQHRAEHDALTGLKSRAHFEALLAQHAEVSGEAITLMFIDLDGFKEVNDRWGHGAGDAVLVEAARRLHSLFERGSDMLGRLGGDEFGVAIAGAEAGDAGVAVMARRVVERFRDPFVLPGGDLARIGASVGVASHPLHAADVAALFRAADAAMYAVKQSGKGGFAIADAASALGQGDGAEWQEAIGSLIATSRLQCDPLTGLMDRRQLIEQLAVEQARVTNGGGPVAVLCVDIDRFKLVNVAHGAPAGDEVLREVSRRLKALVRRGDCLARTGSDEFVAVLSTEAGCGQEDARRMAETVAGKLLDSLSAPVHLSQGALAVRASAGASLIGPDTADGLDALHEAQLALRRAKMAGDGRPVLFAEDMLSGFQERLALEEDLRTAIGTPQMFLCVQPQRDARGRLRGGEALLRWRHPTRGMVPPDRFIGLAETTGLIVELGRWILDAGCRILARMHADGGAMPLAINISPAQFAHPDFVEEVRRALREADASAGSLVLEITEGLLVADMDRAAERLQDIGRLGVRFSIDDFGTGFSNLSYLRRLPLHEIKIDRSFIAGLPDDSASVGIVRSLLSMGSHLGLHVVAEGVETREQSAFLAAEGDAMQQGWLHGRPMEVDDFIDLVRREGAGARGAPD